MKPHVRGIVFPEKGIVSGKEIKRHNPRYGPSTGSVEARTAVAKHVSVPGGEVPQASPQSHPQKLYDSYIFVTFGHFLLDPI